MRLAQELVLAAELTPEQLSQFQRNLAGARHGPDA
jgi:hypothetical protein